MKGGNGRPIVRQEDVRALREAMGRRRMFLSSNSPRRRELLMECGIRACVCRPVADEPRPLRLVTTQAQRWTRHWALHKAMSVRLRCGNGIIVGADTIVLLPPQAMGKPTGPQEARRMLKRLSNRTHQVITGVSVVDSATGRHACGSSLSYVRFRRLSDRDIDAYLQTDEPWDKAGAYAVQGLAGQFVTSVDGPIDNVVGLPIRRLTQLVKRLNNERTS